MRLPTVPERIPMVLWVGTECVESRRAEAFLARLPVHVTLVSLDRPPRPTALRDAVDKLGTGARALLRRESPRAVELELEHADDEAILAAMARYPELIQRPLALAGERAVIARPAELVHRLVAPPLPADGGRDAIRRLLRGRR